MKNIFDIATPEEISRVYFGENSDVADADKKEILREVKRGIQAGGNDAALASLINLFVLRKDRSRAVAACKALRSEGYINRFTQILIDAGMLKVAL